MRSLNSPFGLCTFFEFSALLVGTPPTIPADLLALTLASVRPSSTGENIRRLNGVVDGRFEGVVWARGGKEAPKLENALVVEVN